MSVHISSPTWKLQFKDPTTKLIALSLADQANDDGECWPSCSTIGQRCGVSKDTVQRHLRWLESAGFLQRKERFKDGRQTSNMLLSTPEKMEGCIGAEGCMDAPGGGAWMHRGGCIRA